MEIEVKKIALGHLEENCYLLACGNEAWIIDPGEDAEKIRNAFSLDSYKLSGIINTHGHFDHIGAVADLQQQYNLPFYLHSKDKRLIHQGNLYRKLSGDAKITKTPVINYYLDEDVNLMLGEWVINIHQTPGHTPGSVCFSIDKKLFSGDVILDKEHGRSDLPGGNKEMQQSSVNYIMDNFRGYTLYPGHGEPYVLN